MMNSRTASCDYAILNCSGNRDYNEDALQIQEKKNQILFALADGLGGMGGGAIASSLAISSVMELFSRGDGEFSLEEAMETAREAVVMGQQTHPEAQKMSSTLVLLCIRDRIASWIHIGDSRLYMFRKGYLYAVTEDHSVPQMLVKMGEIMPEQIRHHKDRNRLLRTLGWEQEEGKELQESRVTIEDGDAFLLCSDGFWEEISEKEMASSLLSTENAQSWLQAMQNVVETNGRNTNMDNYSAICVRISDESSNAGKRTPVRSFLKNNSGRMDMVKWGLILILAVILIWEIAYIVRHLL